jgi:hypothetical protein
MVTFRAPVAQSDRASDFESAGRPFESGRAHQNESFEKRSILFKVKEGENLNHRNTL